MPSPNTPTTADLEKLKRELTQAMAKLEQSLTRQQTTSGSSQTGAIVELKRQSTALEQRQNKIVDQINTTLQHARSFDDKLSSRIDALEQRVNKIVDQINTTLQHARGFDDKLSTRIDALERRVGELGRGR
jgi:polyhydroxyalkanoate synthesis regulator phasin